MTAHRLDSWDGTPMDYVRRYYDVPAVPDRRIVFDGQLATVVGAEGGRLLARVDGEAGPVPLHPTWRVDYLDGRGVRSHEGGTGGLSVKTATRRTDR